MDTSLAQIAIGFVLRGEWNEAIKINLQILNDSPEDVDALNRLAKAYAEQGHLPKAREMAQKALKIDPGNTIATKCLEKWKSLKKGEVGSITTPSTESFLEEPGKTKVVSLLNLGEASVLAKLDAGDEVFLSPHAHKVSVLTNEDKYTGRLPDDIAARIRLLMKGGNKYQTLIKSVDPKEITVFIREIEKGKGMDSSPSFQMEPIQYSSFTPPELVHKDMGSMEITETEEIIEE